MQPSADKDAYQQAWRQISYRVMAGRAWSGGERHRFFLRAGVGEGAVPRFVDASGASGLDFPEDGRGIAVTDWDGDGDLDLWITSRTAPRLRLLRNHSDPRAAVGLRLRGRRCNRDAIGARVTLHLANGAQLSRTLRAGEGFLSQGSKAMTWAPEAEVTRVTVRWPGGALESFAGVVRGRRFLLEQGAAKARLLAPRSLNDAWSRDPGRSVPKLGASAIFLAQPRPSPRVEYRDFDGESHVVSPAADQLTLMVLWSRWCPACLRELKELHEQRAQLQQAGVEVVALNVDRLKTTVGLADAAQTTDEALKAVLARTGARFAAGVIDDKAMTRLELQHRALLAWRKPLPLPTSFLVDPMLWLRATYRGRVTPQRVIDDATASRSEKAAWRARAAAGPGFFFHAALPPDYSGQAELFSAEKDFEAALRFVDAALALAPKQAELLNTAGTLLAMSKRFAEAESRFRAAVKADGAHPQARANLAKLLRYKGDITGAITHARAAVERLPANPVLRHLLALCLIDDGQLKQAQAQLLKAREADPNAPVEQLLRRLERDLSMR